MNVCVHVSWDVCQYVCQTDSRRSYFTHGLLDIWAIGWQIYNQTEALSALYSNLISLQSFILLLKLHNIYSLDLAHGLPDINAD
jgi:hypothetical protein